MTLAASLCDPDRAMPPLFPDKTGKGIRIAVIDSGVHPAHPHIDAARIADGVLVERDGSVRTGPEVALDRLGHGTAVTAAILEKAPEATCLPVRVFAKDLRTSATALAQALRWSLEQGVDLVNLSLGTTNLAHAELFAPLVAQAAEQGTVIIAAFEAEGTPCLPGHLPGVLGVTLDWDCPRARYHAIADRPGVLCASGYPRAIAGVPHVRNLYGVSFAVAQITGFAALAREGAPAGQGCPAEGLYGHLMQALAGTSDAPYSP